MQTLREEIEFMRRAHQEEIKEMHLTLDNVGRGFDREMWQNELSQAIHDIQNRYDDQLEKLKGDMEDMYNARVILFPTLLLLHFPFVLCEAIIRHSRLPVKHLFR